MWNCDEEFSDSLVPLDSSKWRSMAELRSGVENLTCDDIIISEFKIQTPNPVDDGAAALRRISQTLENLKDSLIEMIGGAGALSNKKEAGEDTPPQAQRSPYCIEVRDSEVIPQNYEPAPRGAHTQDDILTQEQSNVLPLREHTTGYLPDSTCDPMYINPDRDHPHQDEQKIKKQRKTERE
ncbi:hypothetical protein NDU88_000101 [Pleurodeles waltl]|uniref:Uncharacterized protein n=1 Tax=Pleurodeles waltl TaxID=8319 RepID=A0AAV7KNN3_PLEWA|nr:hypothetical protein NDU88_000101 [Pleurodeles waltl]